MSDLVPPPYNPLSTGTMLVFESEDFTNNCIWRSESSKEHPIFTIRSMEHGKHRVLDSSLNDSVIGEIVFHGAFKFGYGNVSLNGAKAIPIEDWMISGRDVKIHGDLYRWSHLSVKHGNSTQTIFEARRNNELIAVYSGPRGKKTGSSEMMRPHLMIAEGIDFEKSVGHLLLSLIVLEHLERTGSSANKPSFGDAVARALTAVPL